MANLRLQLAAAAQEVHLCKSELQHLHIRLTEKDAALQAAARANKTDEAAAFNGTAAEGPHDTAEAVAEQERLQAECRRLQQELADAAAHRPDPVHLEQVPHCLPHDPCVLQSM